MRSKNFARIGFVGRRLKYRRISSWDMFLISALIRSRVSRVHFTQSNRFPLASFIILKLPWATDFNCRITHSPVDLIVLTNSP